MINNEVMTLKSKKSFTLIEIIIVVGIIAILSSMGIGSYSNVSRNARNQKRKADLKELKQALEYYYSQNGNYPTTAGAWVGPSGSAWYNASYPEWVPLLIAGGYITTLPQDPRHLKTNPSSANAACQTTASNNSYIYTSNGVDYKILDHCAPEGTLSVTDPFADPRGRNYAWAVYSAGGSGW